MTLRVFCATELRKGCPMELSTFASLDVTANCSQTALPSSTPVFLCCALPLSQLGPEMLLTCTIIKAQRDHGGHPA